MIDENVESTSVPFKNIDLEVLRSVAVLLVVINHVAWLIPITHYFLGYVGVDIFFAISGYIITVSLLNSLKKKQKTSTILKSFWTKRVFRILPMAYLWTVIPILIALTFNAAGSFPKASGMVRDGVANITQTANFHWQKCSTDPAVGALCGQKADGTAPLSPFWSLSTEEQFYLIFPLLLILLPRKRLIWIMAAVPLIFILFDRQRYFFTLRFDAIAVGVLLALAQTQRWYKEYYPGFLEQRGLGFLGLIGLCLLIGAVPALSLLPFKQTIVVVIAAILVFIASFNKNLFTRQMPWLRPVFLWIGDRSYAIYLIHVPAILLTREIFIRMFGEGYNNKPLLALLILAVILLLVEISIRCVERPLRQYGRKVAKAIEAPSPKTHKLRKA